MNEKKAKALRKELRNRNVPICAEPYSILSNGQIVASRGRTMYQRAKKI